MSRAKIEYQLSAFSGVIAAGTAANSPLFAWRCPLLLADGSTNGRGQKIRRICAKVRPITGPTAAQLVTLEARKLTAMTANFTGGTDLSDPTAPAYRVIGPDPTPRERLTGTDRASVLQAGNVRIATTGTLSSAGSPVINGFPFAWNAIREAAAATSTINTGFDMVWTPSDEASRGEKGLVLTGDTGFILRNPDALGAGLTLALYVEVAWEEQ